MDDIKKGQGKVISENDQKIAVYKNEQGEVIKLFPKCPHMGCFVDWNDEEKIWECPCHGSKFKPTGEVIQGPAGKPLRKVE